MRVDFMRHQIKAVENQREIDLERVTNNKHKSNANATGNKSSGNNAAASKPLLRSYCPMCDVRFYGPLTGHRKSDRHRVWQFIVICTKQEVVLINIYNIFIETQAIFTSRMQVV